MEKLIIRATHQTPSTNNILEFAAACLIFFATAYCSEFHHSFARSIVGNSNTTILSGFQSPSNVMVGPPLTTKRPSNAVTAAGVSFYKLHIRWGL